MSWDKRVAVNYAKTHAGSHSQGRCAEFTRKAIQAGGITPGHTYHAKDYGPMLRSPDSSLLVPMKCRARVTSLLFNLTLAETRAVTWRYTMVQIGIQILNNAICGPARATGQPGPHIPSTGRINENVLPCRAYPVAL